MHVREIAKYLHSLEPSVEEQAFIPKISGALFQLKESEVIGKIKLDKDNNSTFLDPVFI